MKPLNTILSILLLPLSVLAQTTILNPVGAHSWGMGNAMTALPNELSFFYNPAGLSFAEQNYVNSSFDSRFDIAGLSTASLSASFQTSGLTIAAGAERFGDRLYNENKAGVAVSKNTGLVSLGIKASYLGSYAENITSSATLLTEFGVMAKLHSQVNMGFHAQNLTGARLVDGQKLPTTLRLGLAFLPIKQVAISAETAYTLQHKPFFRAGLEYAMKENLFLRTGINTQIKTNHFGIGYAYKQWQIDYAANTHPALGLSHHISLNLKWQKK
ncbi:hypothetical protein [Jiulongibacter sediminis]|uniref:hypothetical protein n=1 Tax=Jiulongibacter sediminis TaxID=1605367 RepID=UPI0026E94481|nr:hypothetical protein [Jiulongibacter sediminis]